VRVRLADAVSAGLVESTTWTVNVDVPDAVGVPVIAPPELSVRPVGNAPAVTDQVYGNVPPVAANFAEYDLLSLPTLSVVVVTDTLTSGATVMESACDTGVDPAESSARTVNEDVPATVGVPVMRPVVRASFNPLGRVPWVTVYV
jgi:hypothetical protein